MIKNFDQIRQQLEELAPIINSFKSESVQLRLIELIFRGESENREEGDGGVSVVLPPSGTGSKPKRKRRPKTKSKSGASPRTDNASSKPSRGGTGAHAAVTSLVEEGFFKNAQSIRSIIEHLGANKGRHFKANQISPSLLRLLREGKLTRNKNADNQYEYSEA